MPWVQINLLEGRSLEKKHKLHKLVNAAIAEALEIPPDAIKIQLIDMPQSHYSVGGIPNDTRQK